MADQPLPPAPGVVSPTGPVPNPPDEGDPGPAGRNLGAQHTGTPYIAFSDDDSWWAHGALNRAADLLFAMARFADETEPQVFEGRRGRHA